MEKKENEENLNCNKDDEDDEDDNDNDDNEVNNEEEEEEEDDDEVNKLKGILWQQLNEGIEIKDDFLIEEKKVKNFLDNCFQQKISGSMLILGPNKSEKRILINRILNSFKQTGNISVAIIDGIVHTTDQDAFLSITNQLNIISSSDSLTNNIESLQAHFQLARDNNLPTVIVIESIDQYSHASRQVLLYTLLDLLHRPECYYIVIGLTIRADITLLLEKRVLSRLNSECIYIPPRTQSSITQNMKNILTISSNHSDQFKSKIIQTYNKNIEFIFNFVQESDNNNESNESNDSIKSKLIHLIQRDISWGRNMEYFIIILRNSVSRLSHQQPYITPKLLFECFQKMELRCHVFDSIQSLPSIQLYVLVAIIRLYCRFHGYSSTNQDDYLDSIVSIKSNRKRNREIVMIVKDVIHETEKITGLIRRKVVLQREIFHAIGRLAQETELITLSTGKQFFNNSILTEKTIVSLIVGYHELRNIFNSSELKIPDRLRRAVLEPIDTNIFI